MRTLFTWTSAAVIGLLATSVAWAQPAVKPAVQEPGPGIHRMEIWNGPMRTVHYLYQPGLSPSEVGALGEMERAENEVALSDDLLRLRAQYVRNERVMEATRHAVQKLLYGYTSSTSDSFSANYGGGGYGYPYWFGGAYGAYANPASRYNYGFGPTSSFAGFSSSATNSLAYGMGDEGAIKTDMARTLAAQANPEYAAQAAQHLAYAVGRAGQYEPIRTALHLPKAEGGVGGGPIATAGFETAKTGATLTVTRSVDGKSEKIEGKLLREDADWMVLQTKEGKRTISKKQITDVLEPSSDK
jgi:hypothetical protein